MFRRILPFLFVSISATAIAQGNSTDDRTASVWRAETDLASTEVKPLASGNAPAVMHTYPNPACDRVIISAGGELLNDIRVFDMSAREVLVSQNMNMPAYIIEVGTLTSGVYLVRGSTVKGTVTSTLVVE
ncbi:MAG TPA: T9SS type A sorting domain-containing protein [Flavobacteriales bacterium]